MQTVPRLLVAAAERLLLLLLLHVGAVLMSEHRIGRC